MPSLPILQSHSNRVGGIVVCGGQSRRMGRDKARLVVHGKPMLERAVDILGSVCGEVVLACGPRERYAELGLPLVLDAQENGGPLAGILAGLQQLNCPLVAVLACDMPRASAELFGHLFAHQQAGEYDVCFLETEGGREPLCAIYSSHVLPAMEAAMDQGRRRVTSFLEVDELGSELRVGYLKLKDLPLDSESARNLNTPAEYERESLELAP
jgi:molybdopterin-guanine dinucleotide biosynthesis protein A